MPTVCAIFTHFANEGNTLTCLSRLRAQTRALDKIVVINNAAADSPAIEKVRQFAAEHFTPDCLHILQMDSNLGNAGGCAHGLAHAFGTLKADFVWVLDDDSWPRATALEQLMGYTVDECTIRMSLVIDPARGDELSWPLSAHPAGARDDEWYHIGERSLLPAGDAIESRGGWLGALYPRAAWQKVGVPTPELFIRGEDEEYPWKLRSAGFKFVTMRSSELEHPSTKQGLIEYKIGSRSFFYEPGMHVSRAYYKNRNWAWLQRLRYPNRPLLRLAACGVYIVFSLNAMLRCGELGLTRIYQLFRALHNGFYGKLRPFD